MSTSQEIKTKAEEANDAAEQFYKLFYENYDKKRQNLSKIFYLDSSVLVWDGNMIDGGGNIQTFLDSLPTSVTEVGSLDSQPMLSASETSIVVSASGKIKYDGSPQKLFHQNFILVAVNNTWKIASDTMRIFD